jgi:GT2 family glycosyltransferase
MIPQSKTLYTLVVHFGAPEPTNRLVRTLVKSKKAPDGVIVINHGPQLVMPNYQHSTVQVVQPSRNDGYAAGLTTGLGVLIAKEVKPGDIIVCMNNDVQIDSDTISRLRQWWSKHPERALVGPQAGIVNLFTGRTAITDYPTGGGARHVRGSPGVAGWRRQLPITSYRLPVTNYRLPYIHGSFFAAPFAVLVRVRLPHDYFLYWEDVLFSQRVRRHNLPLYQINNLGIKHRDELQHKTGERLYYLVRNGARFLEEETAWLWRVYWWVGNRLRYLYHRLVGGKKTVRLALHDAIQDIAGQAKL